MRTFFRLQDAGITFSEMQDYVSVDGGDDCEEFGGICAVEFADDLLKNFVWDAYDDNRPGEVVVFEGVLLAEIYDGVRVRPIREVARFTMEEFEAGAGREYETW